MNKFLIFIAFITLNSCATLELEAPAVPSEIRRIVKNLPQKRSMVITSQVGEDALGYQYLLFFPFKRITLPRNSSFLFREVAVEYAKRGIDLQLSNYSNADEILVIKDIRVSAYDLLFTRKISATITLEHQRAGRRRTLRGENTTYKKYAFHDQLVRSLSLALRDALEKL